MTTPPLVPTSQSLRCVQPVGITLHDWADRTTGIVQIFGFREKLIGDDWQRWGMNLVQVLSRVKGGQIPRADQFKDWREWAVRINAVIQQ